MRAKSLKEGRYGVNGNGRGKGVSAALGSGEIVDVAPEALNRLPMNPNQNHCGAWKRIGGIYSWQMALANKSS